MESLLFENYIFVAIALIHYFLHRFGLIIMSSLKTMATVVGWVHSCVVALGLGDLTLL